MKKLTSVEKKTVSGGVRWACDSCGYYSKNHLVLTSATNYKNAHNLRYHRGAKVAYIV